MQCHLPPDTDKHARTRLRLTYPTEMEGLVELDPGVGYIQRQFTYRQTVTHQSSNHLITTGPAVKPTTSTICPTPYRCATKPPALLYIRLNTIIIIHTCTHQNSDPQSARVSNFRLALIYYCKSSIANL